MAQPAAKTEAQPSRQDGGAGSPPAGAAAPAETEAANPERAFERLADDESLRRDLADDAFGPLLDLSARLAVARVGRFATTDALSGSLRAFLAGAAEYARSGETADLAQGFGALLTDDEANTVWFHLPTADSPAARAATLARSVSEATGLEENAG